MKTRIRSCAVLFLACIISSLSAQPGTHFLEAEDGTLTSVSVMNTNPGFSGKGYVSNITSDNSSIVFNFESNEGLFKMENKGSNIVQVEQKEPLNEELKNFIECVKSRATPLSDVYSGKRAVEMIELAIKSAKEKRTIRPKEELKM